jgi:ferredoxin
VKLSYVDKDGGEKEVEAKVGQNLVGLAHEHEIDLEGACECSLACSTCHVILEDKIYRTLEPATEEEEDLLDLAFGLTAT